MMTSEGPSSWATHIHHPMSITRGMWPNKFYLGTQDSFAVSQLTVITPQQSPTLDKKKTEQSTTETISDDISTKGIY